MFGNRKMLGLFALAAVAATGLAAAPASAGTYRGGRDRCDNNVIVYRAPAEACAPRGRVSVSLGFYGDSRREYRDYDRGYSRGHRNDRWAHSRGRNDCR